MDPIPPDQHVGLLGLCGLGRDLSSYERADYVKKHGWAKMPGDAEADAKVAEQCAKLLADGKS